jgi:flagellar L-ring protein precursor FlgH
MMKFAFAPTLALAGLAAGCATIAPVGEQVGEKVGAISEDVAGVGRAAHRHVTGPHLAPIDAQPELSPAAYMGTDANANSLWRPGARTFFNDQRAKSIGDIMTVKIAIDDSAEMANTTSRQRAGATEAGVTSLFGKEEALGRLLPPGGDFDPTNLIGADASSTSSGRGSISRQEKIELTVAATIAQILPNGNFIVAGRQQVLINGELRELTVAGVLSPQDIAADNSIRHDQLAEARISYGGAGTLTAVQRPRWGQRVADAISPW